jgi:hypothetical protein
MMMIKFGKQTKDLNRRKICVIMNNASVKIALVILVNVKMVIVGAGRWLNPRQ